MSGPSRGRCAASNALLALEVVFVVSTVLGSILATAPAAFAATGTRPCR